MTDICFLGSHSANSLDDVNLPDDAEIWVVNEAHQNLRGRKPARIFQMHPRNWREAERTFVYGKLPAGCDPDCFGRSQEHVAYLRECGVPVYGQQKWDDIPTSTEYPFGNVCRAVGVPLPPDGNRRIWATSSWGYMAALLTTEVLAVKDFAERHPAYRAGMERLFLVGVELPIGTQRERLWEWPCLAYYLGWLRGLGVQIVLPECGSSLLSAPHYALDGRPLPLDPDHWWLPGASATIYDEEAGVYRLGRPEG